MKVIDAHAHIFPDKIVDKAVKSISDFYHSTPMQHTGRIQELIDSGDKIGVVKYLVFSTATVPHQVESINNFIMEQVKENNKFIGLGTMHIDYESPREELKRLKVNGIHGIKLHPDFQKFSFDDERLYPIYELLTELNMFVLTHAGDYRYEFSNPHRIEKVAKDFPRLNIIAAHFGGWGEWDKAFECLNLPNVYFDTSSTMGFDTSNAAKRAFSAYDPSHIFFATDFPMWDHCQELENIKKLGLSNEIFEGIMYKNFCNFYSCYDKNFTLKALEN